MTYWWQAGNHMTYISIDDILGAAMDETDH